MHNCTEYSNPYGTVSPDMADFPTISHKGTGTWAGPKAAFR